MELPLAKYRDYTGARVHKLKEALSHTEDMMGSARGVAETVRRGTSLVGVRVQNDDEVLTRTRGLLKRLNLLAPATSVAIDLAVRELSDSDGKVNKKDLRQKLQFAAARL